LAGIRRIVGTTESSRKVPISLQQAAFRSGSALQKLTFTDVGVGNVTTNIFPASLTTLYVK